jgi:hypothetical protein
MKYAFLRLEHRHEFHVRVDVAVTLDREVEFIFLKKEAENTFRLIGGISDDYGSRSCEMLAVELAEKLQLKSYKVTSVTVSEDGENGATITIPTA